MSHPPRFHILRQIGWAPFVCFGVAWALSLTEVGRELEWKTLDWRTAYRAIFQGPPDPRIVIALYEDDTETNLVAWPPDRAWHANFSEFLSLVGTAVVTWDVLLDASREGEGDRALAAGVQAAIERGTRIVVAAATSSEESGTLPSGPIRTEPIRHIEGPRDVLFSDAYAIVPYPALREIAPYGFADAPRASDGIVREVPMLVRVGNDVFPSLSLQTLMQFLGVPADDMRVKLGDAIRFTAQGREWRIPVSSDGKYVVNYRFDMDDEGNADFPTYSYRQLLLMINAHVIEKTPGAAAPPDLAGKIVFVGQTVTGKADAGPTPRNAYSPLVLVHANIVSNVLAGDFVGRMPGWLVALVALLAGCGAMWSSTRSSVALIAGIGVLGIVGWVALALGAWLKSVWLPLVWPLVGFGGLQFYVIGRRVLAEQRAKQEIKGMFATYVSPAVVDRLVKSDSPPRLGGHAEEITAFFSDIEGFSSFSEKLPPDRLVELMNEYLTACTDVVHAEGGTLDKYIGDAIVAMFGAPVSQPDHAYRACVAACRIQSRVAELREKWRGEGDKWPESVRRTRTRIGLNTGTCIIGNMGSRTRFNYTMMGDDVNLAARMESGAKRWGVYSMCTEATRRACEQHGKDHIIFRPLGRIVVKGRTKPVPIHEIVGLAEAATADLHGCLEVFAQGLERLHRRDWPGAIAAFRRSAELEPLRPGQAEGVATNPSLVFADLAASYAVNPPTEQWDGVFVMHDK